MKSKHGSILVRQDGIPVWLQHRHPHKSHTAAHSYIGDPMKGPTKPCEVCFTNGWHMMYIDEVFPKSR